jgi:hypothetical protein
MYMHDHKTSRIRPASSDFARPHLDGCEPAARLRRVRDEADLDSRADLGGCLGLELTTPLERQPQEDVAKQEQRREPKIAVLPPLLRHLSQEGDSSATGAGNG